MPYGKRLCKLTGQEQSKCQCNTSVEAPQVPKAPIYSYSIFEKHGITVSTLTAHKKKFKICILRRILRKYPR